MIFEHYILTNIVRNRLHLYCKQEWHLQNSLKGISLLLGRQSCLKGYVNEYIQCYDALLNTLYMFLGPKTATA
jgi:hypothetical protein